MLLFLAQAALNANVANKKAFISNGTLMAEASFYRHVNCQVSSNETLIQQFEHLTLSKELMIGFNGFDGFDLPLRGVYILEHWQKSAKLSTSWNKKKRRKLT